MSHQLNQANIPAAGISAADTPCSNAGCWGFASNQLAMALRANMLSILVAMMKSFSCGPLIFLVCRETVALPQPKLMFG
jgi:hypothetical protein